MKSSLPPICLVTPGHLASTPRLVKAADALAEAGYRVHVVASRHFPPVDPLDEAILAKAAWQCTRVPAAHGWRAAMRRIRRKLACGQLQRGSASERVAAQALQANTSALANAAAAVPAALYFGHGGVAGLAIAAAAARRHRVRYAFDAEDWHEEETQPTPHNLGERFAVRTLLTAHLPDAALLTCAAPLIGDAFAQNYRVKIPTCVLNVFPLRDAPDAPLTPAAPSDSRPAVLYWFSQTIGPGRGLEKVIDVCGRMKTPVTLHLRGFISSAYRSDLERRAAAANFGKRVSFLPVAPASEMVRLAAAADLGLSVEESSPANRDLCLTNKIFTYLLAGVPQLMTPTRAQRQFAAELGPAALLADITAPAATAAALDAWLARPAEITRARRHAADLARSRYCWEIEKHALVDAVTAALT